MSNSTRYSREEMNVLADLLLDSDVFAAFRMGDDPMVAFAHVAEGTGWTGPEFAALARYRWNGSVACQ